MKPSPAVCLWLLVAALSSCKFNPNIQQEGSKELQGAWEQLSVPNAGRLLTSTRYSFTFTCDSVFAVMQTTAKVKQYPGDCFNKGSWTEYARGTYITRNDTLYLHATFTHSNWKQKLTGCYRIGQYLPVFVVKRVTPDSLCLQNILEDVPIKLTLKQPIVCHPKPL